MRPTGTERELQHNMVFTTAMEGGISYWSRAIDYVWSTRNDAGDVVETADFYATIIDEEGGGHRIDIATIRRGIAFLVKPENAPSNSYHRMAVNDFSRGNWDDLDYDADTADLIVQAGLFGEIVYG